MNHLCGWKHRPEHIDKILCQMEIPNFQTPEPENKDIFNHVTFKQITGVDAQPGPQQIGDCTSWGWGHLIDYTAVLDSEEQLVYEPIATESIYAAERVNIGHNELGREDGGIGAWCAKAATDVGFISRPNLDRLGLDGTYSGVRAKDWGYNGMPANVQAAATHTLASTTQVKSFKEAAWHIQQGRVVAVCSDVGFENGPGNITLRDADGFAKRRGTWGHCMCFVSVRMGSRPGLLILNQWPPGMVQGPQGPVAIPECSWWVDSDTVDDMLSQGDSFTGSKFKGYPARKLKWRF